jgi:hypothetical protein
MKFRNVILLEVLLVLLSLSVILLHIGTNFYTLSTYYLPRAGRKQYINLDLIVKAI